MVTQLANVDAHEGDAKQKKDRLGDEWLEQFAERRHGDAEEHERRDRAGALSADPGQRADWQRHALFQNEKHSNLAQSRVSARDHALAARARKVTSRYRHCLLSVRRKLS